MIPPFSDSYNLCSDKLLSTLKTCNLSGVGTLSSYFSEDLQRFPNLNQTFLLEVQVQFTATLLALGISDTTEVITGER